jgi:hypothetical protein
MPRGARFDCPGARCARLQAWKTGNKGRRSGTGHQEEHAMYIGLGTLIIIIILILLLS